MKVKVLNSKAITSDEFVNIHDFWVSPDERYAIIEVYVDELFLVVEVILNSEDSMTVRTIRERWHMNEPDIFRYKVDWSCMKYGFCKLDTRSMESDETKTERFYFDPDLYKRTYEEMHGVPYSGNKTFE